MSPPVAALLSALFFSVGRGDGAGPVWRGCDNGKLWLETDLPPSSMWSCPSPLWPESTQKLWGIDTHYHPQTAQQVCMDTPISYNHSIPNSGASRPVGGESGEYLYCPPQRWINNLEHGATVLLYHPCAPTHQRVRLSVLARSCLSSYIITPHPDLGTHMPFALVSWGRTLELASVAATEVCDWLEETAAGGNRGDDAGSGRYSLLLIRPAEPTRPRPGRTLRRCCREVLSLGPEGEVGRRRRRGGERRRRRGAAVEEEEGERANRTTDILGSVTAGWVNRTLPGSTEPSETQNQGPTPGPSPLGPGPPTGTGWTPGGAPRGPEERGTRRETDSGGQKELAREGPSADAPPVEVREREVGRKRAHHAHVPPTKGKEAESEHRQGGGGVTQDQRADGETYEPLGDSALSGRRPPTARTDEAMWAAAALGFLLVLLALSVLHTRLYRHWRTSPSLYWHDPRHDYDSVADIIRMRLRVAADHRRKRRKRRASLSRREECSLLPSSSSEETAN